MPDGQTTVVTGGLGRSGRWIADRLASEGWEVVVVDQTHPGWEIDAREDLASGAGNFRSYVDARDVAGIVAAALEAAFSGHEPFHAAAADNYLETPIEDALREVFGDLPDDCNVSGDDSALSVGKADEVLDWEPDHSWREAADEEAPEPSLVGE